MSVAFESMGGCAIEFVMHGQCDAGPSYLLTSEHCHLAITHFPPIEGRRLNWPEWLV